ncbi:Panacea domain-containing protein [Caenimonas koreensis]|uniref:Panacea domain-containing protein n=1 Tax=Caenimonas koreensis TaxID=367474 RepID=UPI003784A524
MSYSAYAVANAFIRRAKEGKIFNLSPMKLQKLLFFAQAWHIKHTEGHEPLLDDTFARWAHGPVVPSLYHEFKAFGFRDINREATTLAIGPEMDVSVNIPIIPETDHSAWGLVDAIIHKYGRLSATALSAMTHQEGSAWAKKSSDGSPITIEDILADETIK